MHDVGDQRRSETQGVSREWLESQLTYTAIVTHKRIDGNHGIVRKGRRRDLFTACSAQKKLGIYIHCALYKLQFYYGTKMGALSME
ncbi:hypothetical protein HYFRA_00002531 [Hymenoscyphus fraxineus]|uniref:Uncharacterized protein n=1 Tax=Hymenoscyphus fraxineus TaxID=746836 RepID=A0A9N9LBC4_9HELO|nr:hypothetical protein HYFRA_00002531 [Hymenoscyphus fraxineus]